MPELLSDVLSSRLESGRVAVGQEKRRDGGPVESQACILGRSRGDPADGARADPRRAPAGGLRRRAADVSASSPARRSRRRRPGRRSSRSAVGTGQIKVGLLLPLSGAGNAGVAAQSMRNAAELALAEFQNPEHPAPDQGRRRQPARRAAGRAAGDRRGRRDHPRTAVRASVPARRRSRARAASR